MLKTQGVTEKLVGIVIVNWNGWKDTLDCLESLYRMFNQNFVVVVVDNGSTNQSVTEIRRRFAEIKLVEMGYNSGFSKANNEGIRTAMDFGASFVWLLNNDTVVDPDALSQLLRKAKGKDVGIVGSVLFEADEPERVQAWGGGSLNPDLGTTTLYTVKPARPLEQIIGASMFFPTDVLRRIGLLHEAFFFYLEDTEISFRARGAGYELVVADECFVWHKGGASVNAGSKSRSVISDRYFAQANGVFLGLHASWRSVVFVPLRLVGMVIKRVQRNQMSRIPMVVRAFIGGFIRGIIAHRVGH